MTTEHKSEINQLKEENRKLTFENNEYKAIVSELRIYEICWKKFNPVADVTISSGRQPLNELIRKTDEHRKKFFESSYGIKLEETKVGE